MRGCNDAGKLRVKGRVLTQALITVADTNSNTNITNPNLKLTNSAYPPPQTFSPGECCCC